MKHSKRIYPILALVAMASVAVPAAMANDDAKIIADLAARMEGGGDDGLHWRLKLVNPLPMPEGGQWFEDAGLGLFMHWGPASAYYGSPWVMRRAAGEGINAPMVVAKDYYETSMEKFTAKNYDPEPWMEAASKAGFRYAVLTSKHHDGYTLWPSEHTDLGTQTYLDGRDLLKPYANAVRNNGMKLGFYFSGVDWWLDRDYMNFSWDKTSGWNFAGEPFDPSTLEPLPMEIVEQKRQIAFEVMERYRPDLWWWDSGLPVTLEETALKYNPDMLFNNRGNFWHGGALKGNFPGEHYVTPENFHMVSWESMKQLQALGRKWEVCMNFNHGKGWFWPGCAAGAATCCSTSRRARMEPCRRRTMTHLKRWPAGWSGGRSPCSRSREPISRRIPTCRSRRPRMERPGGFMPVRGNPSGRKAPFLSIANRVSRSV
jgi:alpha-L-fucosidase